MFIQYYCFSQCYFWCILPNDYLIKLEYIASFGIWRCGIVDWKKKKKSKTWEVWVKFYPGQIETIAWEIVFAMSLRNYSEEARRKVSIWVIFMKGEDMQSSTYFFFPENFC